MIRRWSRPGHIDDTFACRQRRCRRLHAIRRTRPEGSRVGTRGDSVLPAAADKRPRRHQNDRLGATLLRLARLATRREIGRGSARNPYAAYPAADPCLPPVVSRSPAICLRAHTSWRLPPIRRRKPWEAPEHSSAASVGSRSDDDWRREGARAGCRGPGRSTWAIPPHRSGGNMSTGWVPVR